MFAYCNNNPVNCVDPSGHLPQEKIASDRIFAYESDSRFLTICIPAPSLLGPIAPPENPEPGTTSLGFTCNAFFAVGISASFGITYDHAGNIGLIFSIETGGGCPGAGIGLYKTEMNCPTIYEQQGKGMTFGGSVNVGPIGVDKGHLVGLQDDWQPNGYYGNSTSVTCGPGLPGEIHGTIGETWILWSCNIYDVWNDFYYWMT